MEKELSTLSDLALVELFKSQPEQVYKEIFDRYWGVLFLHAYRMLRNEADAKDAVQEVFISLWEKIENIRLHSSLSAYLYTSVRNRVLNLISKKNTYQSQLNTLQDFVSNTVHFPAYHGLQEKQLVEAIEQECRNLPPKMRRVFELSRKLNLSHKEIAEKLQISDKTVKKQVNNAIRLIKLKVSYSIYIFLLFPAGL